MISARMPMDVALFDYVKANVCAESHFESDPLILASLITLITLSVSKFLSSGHHDSEHIQNFLTYVTWTLHLALKHTAHTAYPSSFYVLNLFQSL